MESGYFVISLDFELMWGVKDCKTIEDYGDNVLGARVAIPKMLKIFNERGIQCTWATVGLLFNNKKEDLLNNLADREPNYENKKFSAYSYLNEIGTGEDTDGYHFADSLIRLIKQYENQEIASHTFSHYYCLEEGQTIEDFESDISAAKKVAEKYGINISSMVFPRNQVNPDYLDILTRNNILSYRGNEKNWLNKPMKGTIKIIFQRIFRLIDTYINLSGHNCYRVNDIVVKKNLLNIRSSRFLRPYSQKLSFLESLKVRRIKSQMRYAAKHGLVFHIWWHPHNFGCNTDKNLSNLLKILDYYNILNKKYGFESKNLYTLSKEVLNNEDSYARG